MPKGKEKVIVKFEHPCYLCGLIFSKATVVIDHIRKIHGYELPTRIIGHKRPSDSMYIYQNDPNGTFDVEHYSCCSCFFHCPENKFDEMVQHINKEHKPKNIDHSKNTENNTLANLNNQSDTEIIYENGYSDEEEDIIKRPRKSKDKNDSSIETIDVMKTLNEITDRLRRLLN